MRHLFYLGLILLVSCGSNPQGSDSGTVQELQEQDTSALVIEDTIVEIDTTNENLKTLLKEPIDLVEYKEEWGGSNSGGISIKGLYEPDTIGFQYRYMLFWKLRGELKSHPSETDLFNGFRITVYKYGEHAGDFSDTNEELLAIECSLDNTTLGDFNFYGKTRDELVEQIGPAYIEKDNLVIYYYEDRAFSIHLKKDKVDWFKYARLSIPLGPDVEIPDFLLSWND